MYKFKLRGAKSEPVETTMGEMKTGDIAVITDTMYQGDIVMRFGFQTKMVGSLSNPVNWWDSASKIKVRLLTQEEVSQLSAK